MERRSYARLEFPGAAWGGAGRAFQAGRRENKGRGAAITPLEDGLRGLRRGTDHAGRVGSVGVAGKRATPTGRDGPPTVAQHLVILGWG
jgi:hypothetical protein